MLLEEEDCLTSAIHRSQQLSGYRGIIPTSHQGEQMKGGLLAKFSLCAKLHAYADLGTLHKQVLIVWSNLTN
jgi:hypothetical protein